MTEIDKLIEQLRDKSVDVRIRAAHELRKLGPDFSRAWQILILEERFCNADDPRECKALDEALAGIDQKRRELAWAMRNSRLDRESARERARKLSVAEARHAINNLIWSFGDTIPPDNCFSFINQCQEMVAIGLEVPAVIPDLLELFKHDDRLRTQIGYVLGHIGAEREEVGEALVPLLKHKDPAVVKAAASAIAEAGGAGSKGEEAVQILLGLYEQEPESFYDEVTFLGIEKGKKEVTDLLIQRVRCQPSTVLLALLGEIAACEVPEAIAGVLDLLCDDNPTLRGWMASHCGEDCYPSIEDKNVIQAVCAATKDTDASVRRSATASVGRYAPRWSSKVMPYLVAALDDSDATVRHIALDGVSNLGAAGKPFLPMLQEKLKAARQTVACLNEKYKTSRGPMRSLLAKLKAGKAVVKRLEEAIQKIAESPD